MSLGFLTPHVTPSSASQPWTMCTMGKFILPATPVIPLLSWRGSLPSCTSPLVHRVVLAPHTPWGLLPMPEAVPSRALPSSSCHPPCSFLPLSSITAYTGHSASWGIFWCFWAKEDEEAFLGGRWCRETLWRPDRVRCSLVFAPEVQSCVYSTGLPQMLPVQICKRSGESVDEQAMQT